MVQLSTPWGDPEPGNGPPVRRFLSNYFDLLFIFYDFMLHPFSLLRLWTGCGMLDCTLLVFTHTYARLV